MDGPRWYYETQAFVRTVGKHHRDIYWHTAGYPKGALRGHAILAKRLRRLSAVSGYAANVIDS